MSYYENRGRVPSTDVVKYMAQGVRKERTKPKRTRREFGGAKLMLSKATRFVSKIFKRRKV